MHVMQASAACFGSLHLEGRLMGMQLQLASTLQRSTGLKLEQPAAGGHLHEHHGSPCPAPCQV